MFEQNMYKFNVYVTKESLAPILINNLISIYNVKSVKSSPIKYSRMQMGEAVGYEDCTFITFMCEPYYAQAIIDYLEKLVKESPVCPCIEYICTKFVVMTKDNYFVSDLSKLLNDNAELRIYDNNKAVVCKNEFPTDFTGDYRNAEELIKRWNNRE